MSKIAVVLFNLGGPDSSDAVQPFLFNLFNDKAIIGAPQPIRWLIAKLISTRRAPVAQEIYAELGGKSPLLENTQAQADALEQVLSQKYPDDSVKCFMAMRYWHPMAPETAAAVQSWGADEVMLVPLYPQFSTTTTGSSFQDWEKAATKSGISAVTSGICCYPANKGFIASVTARLRREIAAIESEGPFRVLFSAHGLPKKIVESGDPYQWAVEQSASAVVAELGMTDLDWRVSYQSRVGPLEWIKPYTEDEIRLAGEEKRGLIIVPIAFVSEHSETLVELDIEYRELADEAGVLFYRRVGTVADDSGFIDGLADIVADLRSSGASLSGPDGKRICPAECARCAIPG